MEVQLNPFPNPQNQTPTVDLGPDQGFELPSQQTASNRAAKATFGLGDIMGKSYDDFYSRIVNGQEPQLRNEAASTVDLNKIQRKKDLVQQAVATGVSSEDLLHLASQNFNEQDPRSVVEEYHAAKYMQPLLNNPDNLGAQIDKAYASINAGVTNLTYKNLALTRLQKSVDNYKNQPLMGSSMVDVPGVGMVPEGLGWTGDQLKNLSQIYTEYKLRGGYSGKWDGLLGSSLAEEITESYKKSPEDFKLWLNQRMDELDKTNPTLALAFGSAVVGQSLQDIRNSDLTTFVGVPSDLANLGAGAALKALNKVRGAVQGAVASAEIIDPSMSKVLDEANGRGSASTLKDITPNNDIPKSVTPEDIKQAQAAGQGNIKEAGINVATKDVVDRFENKQNTAQNEIKSLPAILNPDKEAIQENVGSLGTDVANRIKDQIDKRQVDFNKGMTDLIKVNRTPVVVAGNDTVRAAFETFVKDKYAGKNSTVMDGSGRILLYDSTTNTYHLNLDIGNQNGEYFGSEAEAISHAELNELGLHEPSKSARQYWDDKATAAAFEVEQRKYDIMRYENELSNKYFDYGPNQFKPKSYHEDYKKLQKMRDELKQWNQIKKNAWAQRAGSYWKPDQTLEERLGKTTLQKQGQGWYIQGWVPLDETHTIVRDGLLKVPGAYTGPARKGRRKGTNIPYLEDFVTGAESTKQLSSLKVMLDSFGGERLESLHSMRIPDEVLSPEENVQRKVATHVPGKFASIMFDDDVKLIKAVPAKYADDLRRVLVANQTMMDPNGEQGHFFNNLNDLENFYKNYIGRSPTEAEAQAYFAVTGIYEKDRGARTVAMLRNKWRAGVESHRIKIGGKWTEPFDAVLGVGSPPTAFEKSPVYIAVEGGDAVKASGTYTAEVKQGLLEGKYRWLELWNREDRPFHSMSRMLGMNTEPQYVITDNLETRPLDPNKQIPRRSGGHWVFPHKWYTRQANTYYDTVTKQWIYKGDSTHLAFNNEVLGRQEALKMNEVRNLIREGLIDDARDFVRLRGVGGLDFDRDILPRFRPTFVDGVWKPAQFNMHEPFQVVPVDKTIRSMNNDLIDRYDTKSTSKEIADAAREHLKLAGTPDYKGELMDTTRRGNMARSYSVEFTGERDAWDLHTIEDTGTANNPVYQYRPAGLVDPIDVINRSLTRLSNSLWLDDMKYYSSEHWFQDARRWLDFSKGEFSPMYHFLHPVWVPETPDDIRRLLMSVRKKSRDFISMESPLATFAEQTMQRAVANAYSAGGPPAEHLMQNISEVSLISHPIRALQRLTGDLKIGLFSIPAAAMQIAATANLIGFEPRFVGAAVRGALLHQYGRLIPQHLETIDKLASFNLNNITGQIGFRPGHFTHLMRGATEQTDFLRVGSEHAFVDAALSDRYITTKADAIRYWSSSFFREGAQFTRTAAWYASGLKWIEDHGGELPSTRDHWAQILQYATDMDHNMSRASNSTANTGLLGIPFKFMTYDRNMFEIFMGKRFTPAQKARLFATNSMLWGLRGMALFGTGAAAYGFWKGIRENNPWVSAVTEGVPAWLTHQETNIWSDYTRFGMRGWITQMFADQPHWWQMLGAMPSTVINTYLRGYPMWQNIAGAMKGITTSQMVNVPGVGAVPGEDGDWHQFQPTAEDFSDLFKEWAGYNNSVKLYKALKFGRLYSTNNTNLLSVTSGQAWAQFLTGIGPTNLSEMTEGFGILGDRKSQLDWVVLQGTRNYQLALQARASNNSSLENTYMIKLMNDINDLAPDQRDQAMKTIFSRNRPLFETIEEQVGLGRGATPEQQKQFRGLK